jgi:hypothetical protein
MRTSLILVVVIAVIWLAAGLFRHVAIRSKDEDVKGTLVQLCAALNKTCPIVIDKMTTLNAATCSDHDISFVYTLSGVSDEEGAQMKDGMRMSMTSLMKSNSQTRVLFDNRVLMHFCFKNPAGKVLLEFDIQK